MSQKTEKQIGKPMLRNAIWENPMDIINEDENKAWGSGYPWEYWRSCQLMIGKWFTSSKAMLHNSCSVCLVFNEEEYFLFRNSCGVDCHNTTMEKETLSQQEIPEILCLTKNCSEGHHGWRYEE